MCGRNAANIRNKEPTRSGTRFQREERTAVPLVVPAEHLIELQPHHLDGHQQGFHGGHKDVAQNHGHSIAEGAKQSRQGEHRHHHSRMDQHKGRHPQKRHGVGKIRQQSLEQLKKGLEDIFPPFFRFPVLSSGHQLTQRLLKEHGNQNGQLHRINHFSEEETRSLRELMECSHPDWEVLFHLYHDRKMNPMSFLKSEQFLNILTESCLEKYPYIAFADAFHTMRSMLLPVLYLLGSEVPQADTYHAISTGYGGLLACLGGYVYRRPVLLTEHGIYTREREEEIIRAKWVIPSFKKQWISFFYMLSEAIYKRAFRVTSLFTNAMLTQIQIGCDAEKCRVIENGIDYDRLSQIPLKEEDGWIDIGAVVRLAPIKDIKTMIYAFYELSSRMENVRLHILGGVDDEEYADECYALVKQLDIKNLVFTGRVDIVQYMRKLDFTILTSISEGQPLSVLESFAARRPCVTTDVGCCRELLNGKEGDDFGCAGYCVPPMYRDGLAFAMEKMCESRRRRIRMGKSGQARTKAYYRHERMISEYRKLYREVEEAYGRDWI